MNSKVVALTVPRDEGGISFIDNHFVATEEGKLCILVSVVVLSFTTFDFDTFEHARTVWGYFWCEDMLLAPVRVGENAWLFV